jgi:DNA-binding CsgD family transcriptional regulator
VAYHFQQVGDPRAVTWLIAAGDRAQDAYAWPTAVARFEAALSVLEAGDEEAGQRGWLLYRIARLQRHTDTLTSLTYLNEAARLAATVGDVALAAGVTFTRGVCRRFLGDFSRGLPELAAGVEAIEALAPAARARLNAHSDIGDFAFVRGTLALHLGAVGRFAEAVTLGERYRGDPPEPEEGGVRWGSAYVDGIMALANAYVSLGKVEAAQQLYRRAFALHRECGNYLQLALQMEVIIRFILVRYQTEHVAERHAPAEEIVQIWQGIGGITDAEAAFLASLSFLRLEGRWDELNAPIPRMRERSFLFVWVPIEQAIVARDQGDRERAWATIRQLLPDGPQMPLGAGALHTSMLLRQLAVELACDADDLTEARAWLEAHDRWLGWSGAVLGRAEGDTLWARYHWQAGDRERAYAHAERALVHASEPRQPLALLAAYRLLGELDADAGRSDHAARHLDAALRLAEACQAPYERALTLIALANLRAATGAAEDARALLDEAQAICAPLGARPALARIAAIQSRLAATPAAPAYPAGLSPREVEVLRLVAQGWTDRQVADHLFLSPRTINQHLRSIYNKLGVSTRAAATHFAVQQGIA